MIAVQDLFETHVTTADLARSVQFYKDVIGLRLAHVTSTRGAAFFWIGPGKKAMLGVWLTVSGPQRMQLHTAFQVSLADVVAAPQVLAAAGISPLDFDGETTDEPVVLAWMPAASVFFRDPDGHLLEFIAMLPDEPDADRGVVRWSAWARAHGTTSD
jgi:lactoylglutathione lyase